MLILITTARYTHPVLSTSDVANAANAGPGLSEYQNVSGRNASQHKQTSLWHTLTSNLDMQTLHH